MGLRCLTVFRQLSTAHRPDARNQEFCLKRPAAMAREEVGGMNQGRNVFKHRINSTLESTSCIDDQVSS